MDNHLGNNERFSILPGHKSSLPLAPPPPRRQVPGRAHLVVAGNKEKQRKGRVIVRCVIPSPPPSSHLRLARVRTVPLAFSPRT